MKKTGFEPGPERPALETKLATMLPDELLPDDLSYVMGEMTTSVRDDIGTTTSFAKALEQTGQIVHVTDRVAGFTQRGRLLVQSMLSHLSPAALETVQALDQMSELWRQDVGYTLRNMSL